MAMDGTQDVPIQPATTLLSILGEYWWRQDAPLPSAALVALLADFGVSDAAARTTLSRLTARRLLVPTREGRRTFYSLSPRAESVLADGAHRIFGFGPSAAPWDGDWTIVMYSVPEKDRTLRNALRSRLRWNGMASLYDAVWLAPRNRVADAMAILDELHLETATVAHTSDVQVTGRQVLQSAWDILTLGAQYDAFITYATRVIAELERGGLAADGALVGRTMVTEMWRNLRESDPDLPNELLPEGWRRSEAWVLFDAAYTGLGPLASQRVADIVRRYEPRAADSVSFRATISDVLADY